MKRLFAAIKIQPDENFLKVYYQLVNKLKEDSIKWVEPENIHLTLKFFGETDEGKIDDICQVLDEVCREYQPFTFRLQGVRIFGSSYNPKVIWFGIENNELLKKIGNHLVNDLSKAGFLNDRQNFVPHLTVGRIKELRHKNWFQTTINHYSEKFIQEINVDEICLFESILKPGGPTYLVIEKFKLT